MGNSFSSSQPNYQRKRRGSRTSSRKRAEMAGQPDRVSGFGDASMEGFGGMSNSLFSFKILYLFILFVALTPGVLLTLPTGGAKITVAVVHALVFGVVWTLTSRPVLRALR
jgi:hypothetical protein